MYNIPFGEIGCIYCVERRITMVDIKRKLVEIDGAVSENEIYLKYGLLSLAMFEIKEYTDLICEINRMRDAENEMEQRKAFIPLYKKVFLEQRKKLERILENTQNGTITIEPMPTEDEMKSSPLETLKYDDVVSRKKISMRMWKIEYGELFC